MNLKTLTTIAVAAAVISAAVAAIVVSIRRSDQLRALAEVTASKEAIALAEQRTAASNKEAEAKKLSKAEAEKETKRLEVERQTAERQTAEAEDRRQQALQRTKEAEAETARAAAEKARADTAAEKAKVRAKEAELETVRSEQAANEAKAREASALLAVEKLKADKTLAEAKLLELQKVDFESWQRNLIEWKQDLEERERALVPEKTISDLAWAGGEEDSVVDDKGNLTKLVKRKYDPEKDVTLPATTRELAKQTRIRREVRESREAACRATVIERLVRLYEQSLAAGKVVDADFYYKSILALYPDWKYGE